MRLATALCLIAVTLTPLVVRTSQADTYRHIVEQYRSDPNEATRQLLAFPRSDLDLAVNEIAAANDWTPQQFDAALLLHTDAALYLTKQRDSEAWRLLGPTQPLSEAAARDAENGWFLHQWFRAIVQIFKEDARVREFSERWQKQTWRDAAGLLEAAAVQERMGSFEPSHPAPLLGSHIYNPLQFRIAQGLYERALEGGLLVAAVHIGRFEMLRGKDAAARARFVIAADRATSPTTRYLGNLFLGSMDGREGDTAAARTRYEAALRAYPYGQSGRLSLAALLARQGLVGQSARLVADRAANDERYPMLDPWWSYLPPTTYDPLLSLATLYSEVRR